MTRDADGCLNMGMSTILGRGRRMILYETSQNRRGGVASPVEIRAEKPKPYEK